MQVMYSMFLACKCVDSAVRYVELIISGMSTPPQSQPAVEEEEEEEQDDDQNVPDLTAFAIEDMKQCGLTLQHSAS